MALPPPSAPAAPPLQLSGIVIGPDRAFAVVKRLTDAKPVSLSVGREIDGWTVTAIEASELALRMGDQVAVLRMPSR